MTHTFVQIIHVHIHAGYAIISQEGCDTMAISEARKRANQAYIDKQDELKIRVPKGRKAEIQAHAEAMGESLNAFVGRAINEAMERDRQQ